MAVTGESKWDYLWFIGAVLLGAEPVMASIALKLFGVPDWLSVSAIPANVIILVLGVKWSQSHADRKGQVAAEMTAKRQALEKEERNARREAGNR